MPSDLPNEAGRCPPRHPLLPQTLWECGRPLGHQIHRHGCLLELTGWINAVPPLLAQ